MKCSRLRAYLTKVGRTPSSARDPLVALCLAGAAFAQSSGCLIQPSAVGPIHEGMTVAQARQALRGATLKPTEDAKRLPILSVIRDGLHTMDLYVDAGQGVKETSKIDLIRVFDGACATRDGVHPGMRLAEVAQRYGRLTRLKVTDTESREYAEFERLPAWLEIQVGNGQTGIYPTGKRCTSNYAPAAHIASLWVSHPVTNKPPEDDSICNAPLPRR
jgi:hypothetical protein